MLFCNNASLKHLREPVILAEPNYFVKRLEDVLACTSGTMPEPSIHPRGYFGYMHFQKETYAQLVTIP